MRMEILFQSVMKRGRFSLSLLQGNSQAAAGQRKVGQNIETFYFIMGL